MKNLVLVAALGAALSFADTSFVDSDSGIFGPKYSEILKKIETWKADYSEISTVIDYGKSIKGRTLRLLLVMKPGNFSYRPTFLMSGSTHGNEYLAIEDRLPEELLKKSGGPSAVRSFLDKGGVFIFIPILNPDGYDDRKRENAHGTDLNRDWDVPSAAYKGFKEVETKALADKLASLQQIYGLTFKVTVDYHCCIGALLYPWSYTEKPIPQAALTKHQAIGKMAKDALAIESGTTPVILGYKALGTTKDYYYDKYRALGFTYEGIYSKEKNNLPQHVAWWETMIQGAADGALELPPLFKEDVFLSNL